MKRVTVYITTYNYGRYLKKAIESVLAQTLGDWELIVINDGSTDNTSEILKKYQDNPKITIINQENRGLATSNNIALRLSNGKYLIRLDGDDYFDENILMILANILDTKPEIGLVYPDYYRIDKEGEIIDLVHLNKVDKDKDLLDLSAHGAGTMIRKSCLMDLKGYEEKYLCQDGYQLWLRFIQYFKPYNVNLPLFYYRQHSKSLTVDKKKISETKANIERDFINNVIKKPLPKTLAIVPAVGKPVCSHSYALKKIAGKPLIWYTLRELLNTKCLDKIVLATDSKDIAEYVSKFKKIEIVMRPKALSGSSSALSAAIYALGVLKKNNYLPEAVLLVYVTTPLRKAQHIERALNTMAIFDTDSVISVTETPDFFYQHTNNGLQPLQKNRRMRIERNVLHRENGLIYLSKIGSIKSRSFLGTTIGHIITLPEESIKINSEFEFWQVEKILEERNS